MSKLQTLHDILIARYGNTSNGVKTFCDKGTDHSYIDLYAHHFSRCIKDVNLLEIGVMSGGSLLLWSKYFEKYKLTGIDLSPTWSVPLDFHEILENDPNIELHFNTNSTDPISAAKFKEETFDFIIDDGAHDPETQFDTFQQYFLKVKRGGTYFIEDVRGPDEFRDLSRSLMNWLNARKVNAGINVYYGDLSKRIDDIVIIIDRV